MKAQVPWSTLGMYIISIIGVLATILVGYVMMKSPSLSDTNAFFCSIQATLKGSYGNELNDFYYHHHDGTLSSIRSVAELWPDPKCSVKSVEFNMSNSNDPEHDFSDNLYDTLMYCASIWRDRGNPLYPGKNNPYPCASIKLLNANVNVTKVSQRLQNYIKPGSDKPLIQQIGMPVIITTGTSKPTILSGDYLVSVYFFDFPCAYRDKDNKKFCASKGPWHSPDDSNVAFLDDYSSAEACDLSTFLECSAQCGLLGPIGFCCYWKDAQDKFYFVSPDGRSFFNWFESLEDVKYADMLIVVIEEV